MTTRAEAAALLTIASAFDNREVTEAAASAWAEALDPRITPEDGRRIIVAHYGRTRDWIMPADINAANRAIRGARVPGTYNPPLPPDALHADVQACIAWQRGVTARIGDGLTEREAVEATARELGVLPPPLIDPPTRPVAALLRAMDPTPGRPSGRPSSSQEES